MDKEKQLDKLESEKSRFRRNSTVCYIAIAYLIYTSYKDFETAPIYFTVIMVAIIVGILAISIYAKKREKQIKIEIEKIREELGMNDPAYWEALEEKYNAEEQAKNDESQQK